MKSLVFVRSGRFLVPRSEVEVKKLFKCNIRSTRVNVNLLPTLKTILRQDIEIEEFDSLLDSVLQRLQNFWRGSGRTMQVARGNIRLTSNNRDDIQQLSDIEQKLRAFFARWGHRVECTINRTKTRIVLFVSYESTASQIPLIQIGDASHEVDFSPAVLSMGKYRLTLSVRENGHFGFSFEERQFNGDFKKLAEQTRLSVDELKSDRLISTLFNLFNK